MRGVAPAHWRRTRTQRRSAVRVRAGRARAVHGGKRRDVACHHGSLRQGRSMPWSTWRWGAECRGAHPAQTRIDREGFAPMEQVSCMFHWGPHDGDAIWSRPPARARGAAARDDVQHGYPGVGRPRSRATQDHLQLYLNTSVNLNAQELRMTLTFDFHDCERAQIGRWFGGWHTRGS
jgi:hypothetical protein